MKKHKLIRVIFQNLILLLIFLCCTTIIYVKVVHAFAPLPGWWVDNNGVFSQYDDYQFKYGRNWQGSSYVGSSTDSAKLSLNSSFDGVAAIGPVSYVGLGGDTGGTISAFFTPDATASAEVEWQCTELVKRFLFTEYGARSIGNTNGYQVVDNYSIKYPNLFQEIVNNGSVHVYPLPGDVLSYSNADNDGGHTAIVQSVSGASGGSATVQLVEQNSSASGITNQTFSSWEFQNGRDNSPSDAATVSGWLTRANTTWTNVSPSGTTFDQINAMSATSSSNVWAAGWEKPTGSNRTPVAYVANFDGTQWTKKSPGSGGIDHNYLMGITQGGGYVWTVGYITQSPNLTLAYKYNGSSWSRVTSDNPSATYGNLLLAAATDGSGTPWAAGYYYDGTNYQPIIEKWNGTKFAQQTISLPTGFTGAQLKGIAFSSSTNGWAVGTVSSSSAATNVMYHYDGTSWTPTVGINYKASLYAVTTVSDTEAWAIGGQNSGQLILHYVNGAWTEDTSFNGHYPSFTSLTSVSADSPTDVWIAGSAGSNTYTMHYNGSWSQITTPTISGASSLVLNAIAVTSGIAWAGGLNQQTGQSYPYPIIFKTQ